MTTDQREIHRKKRVTEYAEMSAEDCTAFCVANGKTVKSYRVGGVVPIFHPRPRFSCECDTPPPQPTGLGTP